MRRSGASGAPKWPHDNPDAERKALCPAATLSFAAGLLASRAMRGQRRDRLTVLPGLLLAVLALVSQLALGTMVLPDDAAARQQAELDVASVLCTGAPAPVRHAPAQHHRVADGALCPLSIALALPSVVPVLPPMLPAPTAGRVLRLATARSARGPPSLLSGIGYPRGPPVLA